MYTDFLVAFLTLDNPVAINNYLADYSKKHNSILPATFADSYLQTANYFEAILETLNPESEEYEKCADVFFLFLLAHFKESQYQDELESTTKRIANVLIDETIESIDGRFGPGYTLKNPQVFSTTINTFRSVYMSMKQRGE